MKKTENRQVAFDDYLGCFGDFCIEDPVCKKFCALNLRCAIEREQIGQMELLEEIVSFETMFMRIQ